MALSTPAGIYLLVGGINVTGDIYSASVELENLVEETHTFGDSMEETTPVGIGRLTLSTGEGLYDDRVSGQLEAFRDAPLNTTQLCMLLLMGDDPGASATMLDGIYTVKYNRGPKKDGLTMATAEHVVNAQYNVDGRVVHGFDALTTDGNTESTPVDMMFPFPAVDIVASFANDVITTRTQHGLKAGDRVFIAGHTGSTPSINSTAGTMGSEVATVPDNYSFTLTGVNITVAGTGGTAKKANGVAIEDCGNTNSIQVVTYSDHGLSVGDRVTFEGTGSDIDAAAPYDAGYEVLAVIAADIFTLNDPGDPGNSLVIANTTTAAGRLVKIGQASAFADLHVPSLVLDGATNLVVKIRHSDEAAANYTDAVTFTAVTAIDASERKTITDLKRFRACSWTFTGGAGANTTAQVVSAVEFKR